VLLVRGRVGIDVDAAYIQEYLDAARRYAYTSDWPAFEAGVRTRYDSMARIAVVPSWAKILDATRLPETVARLSCASKWG
jgi:hypothetical protein